MQGFVIQIEERLLARKVLLKYQKENVKIILGQMCNGFPAYSMIPAKHDVTSLPKHILHDDDELG